MKKLLACMAALVLIDRAEGMKFLREVGRVVKQVERAAPIVAGLTSDLTSGSAHGATNAVPDSVRALCSTSDDATVMALSHVLTDPWNAQADDVVVVYMDLEEFRTIASPFVGTVAKGGRIAFREAVSTVRNPAVREPLLLLERTHRFYTAKLCELGSEAARIVINCGLYEQ
jgi:hypothetical protein